MQQKVTAQIGATPISIETGKIARLADGAVVVTCGDTMVLASAVSATTIKEGQDYFALTVEYSEKSGSSHGYFNAKVVQKRKRSPRV
jgi:polyribonucleotide nucleotidyltransferase